jgi:hypothetical protein
MFYRTGKPTKKITKGRVKRRREASFLARLGHSCVRNALLEMVDGALNYNGGRTLTGLLSWPNAALTCQTRDYCY